MALDKYIEKRNFDHTSEPKGIINLVSDELIFVVQKHDATNLHYDFRLELDGVLTSWAIPKGPSMNPEDKRLAIMVEDHPFDYKDFEGIIPEGNYGAGEVIIWDNGKYKATDAIDNHESVKLLHNGLKKGHLAIFLEGSKLKGEFDLIKLYGRQENAWLLIKKKDEYATDLDILKQDKSVVSTRSIEELKKKRQTL